MAYVRSAHLENAMVMHVTFAMIFEGYRFTVIEKLVAFKKRSYLRNTGTFGLVCKHLGWNFREYESREKVH